MKCAKGGQCVPGPEQPEGNLLVRYCTRCGRQTGFRRKGWLTRLLTAVLIVAAGLAIAVIVACISTLIYIGVAR